MHKIPDHILVLPRLRVQYVNCISGPLTWGFPPVSSFCGFTHAISRKLGGETVLNGTGIISHSFESQVHKTGYDKRFSQTRNPLESDGSTAGIIEEGRAHITVSLLIGVYGEQPDIKELTGIIQSLKLAGGSILPIRREPYLVSLNKYKQEDYPHFRKTVRKFLPGFTLLDRSDFLAQHHAEMQAENPDKTLLDALLDLSALKYGFTEKEDGKADWYPYSEKKGWLVPIPVGYVGISPVYQPGEVRNTRDGETPFRFVEAAYSLGEWKNPLKLNGFDEMLWFYDADGDVYSCTHKKFYE